MSFFSVPVITRTKRPTLLDGIWPSVPGSAATSHDVTGTLSNGADTKLIRVFLSDGGEYPTGCTLDPGGDDITMNEIDGATGELGNLRCAAWYRDAPDTGSQTTRVATSGSVWSMGGNFNYQNARAGMPHAVVVPTSLAAITATLGLDESGDFTLLLIDAYSITLVAFIADGLVDGEITLTNSDMTTIVDDEVNSAFLAAYSHLLHENSGERAIGATLDSAQDCLMMIINIPFSFGQTVNPEVETVHHWALDDMGPSFSDSQGNGNLGVTSGTVLTGVDPLLADGGTSISLGGNVALVATESAVRQVSAYWVTVFFQSRAQPTSGNHTTIMEIDVGSPGGRVGGMATLEYHNDGGTSRIRSYIRGADTAANFFGSSDGVGTLSENTGYRLDLFHDGTDAYLYLDKSLLATLTGVPSLSGVSSELQIGSYSSAVLTPFDGIIDEVIFRSGCPSDIATTLSGEDAAQTVSPDPGGPGTIVAVDDVVGNVTASTTTDVDVLANDTNKTGPDYHIVIESDPSSRLSVINNDGASAQVRITAPAAPTETVQESGAYSVAEGTDPSYGNQSSTASISWTRQAAAGGSYTPFAFITTITPSVNHTGVASRPSYSASDPTSATIVDPMSGIDIVRVGGDKGDTVYLTGSTDSGLVFPSRLRNENSPQMGNVWNADGTLLMIARYFSRAGDSGSSCRTYIIDVDASHGASQPFQIIRASSSVGFNEADQWWFWDRNDPLRAIVVRNSGQIDEWWPIGGDGHSVGETNLLVSARSGFGSHNQGRRHMIAPSWDGTYYVTGCRRNSDSVWGGYRINLSTGAFGPFMPDAFSDLRNPTADSDFTTQSTSSTGLYTTFNRFGNRWRVVRTTDGVLMSDTGDGAMSHYSWTETDGDEYLVGGLSTTTGFRLFDVVTGAFFTKASMGMANPQHTNTTNILDLIETYGATGSGNSTGQRYAIWTKATPSSGTPRTIAGIRLGSSDSDAVRYICNHRSVQSSNSSECHAQISPDGRKVVFASNWQSPGVASGGDVHPYVALIPDGWWSPNNDGS